MGILQVNEEMHRRKQETREKQYSDFNQAIDRVEKNKNYKTEEELLLEEKKKWKRKMKLFPILFSVCLSCIGCVFLSIGICIVLKLILKDIFWLGIAFLVLGILIFILVYPIQKKIFDYFQGKYYKAIKKMEEVKKESLDL
ncbi:MAG: hypothetical protein K2J85_06285 [Anaeroplasmataceae bacterium]|nr:hypothetical protein [Anaeroplasmataceae bacterium]